MPKTGQIIAQIEAIDVSIPKISILLILGQKIHQKGQIRSSLKNLKKILKVWVQLKLIALAFKESYFFAD